MKSGNQISMRPLQNVPFCLRQRTLADQAQILILKILNVFLWLKFSPALPLTKLKRFETGSPFWFSPVQLIPPAEAFSSAIDQPNQCGIWKVVNDVKAPIILMDVEHLGQI